MPEEPTGAVEPRMPEAPAEPAGRCANCDEPLRGPYCAICGQHARGSARSLVELCEDCVHVVTHADGRFWKTIRSLLLVPGQLTQEYFLDHRQRYLPPVRLYIVLSILFFALAQFGESGLKTTVDLSTASAAAASAAQEQALAQGRAECAQDNEGESELARKIRAQCLAALDNNGAAVKKQLSDLSNCSINFGPAWLQHKLMASCQRAVKDRGAALTAALKQNIPRMMFVLLPLVAAFMMLLYWHPRRLYVEHLVYFLHTQSAMYLAFIILLLLEMVTTRVRALSGLQGFAALALVVYAIWYWYASMRRSYGQGRWRTLAKLVIVGTAYLIILTLTSLATLAVSFFQA